MIAAKVTSCSRSDCNARSTVDDRAISGPAWRVLLQAVSARILESINRTPELRSLRSWSAIRCVSTVTLLAQVRIKICWVRTTARSARRSSISHSRANQPASLALRSAQVLCTVRLILNLIVNACGCDWSVGLLALCERQRDQSYRPTDLRST